MANEYMGNNAKERICYWAQLLLLPVYGLSFLTPRDKKIWLFGSTFGRRFTDNPRYLYMYVNHFSKVRFGRKSESNTIESHISDDIVQDRTGSQADEDGIRPHVEERLGNIRPIWISHNREVVGDLSNAGYEAGILRCAVPP